MSTPEISPVPPPPAAAAPRRRWYHYAAPIVMGLFCVELGILLVLLPWLDVYEHDVYAYVSEPLWPFFLSASFRAALSAVGFLNFIVALNEFLTMGHHPANGGNDAASGRPA
jgi:hypothetical protein